MATQLIRSHWESDQEKNWRNSLYFSLLNSEPFIQQKSHFLQHILQHLDIREGERLLDLHAEKGDITRQLYGFGYRVDGLDNSATRIQYAKQFEKKGLCFQLNESAEQLTPDQYRFVYSLNDHFGQLSNETEQINYLNNVASSLCANGYLLIDFFNIQTLLPTLPLQRFQRIQNVLFQIRGRQHQQFIQHKIKVQDGPYRGTYTTATHIHFRESFEYLFLRAGLQIMRTYGDYELQPFCAETSPRLILLVEKR